MQWMQKQKISVIIVNFETPDDTLECLNSLYQYPPHPSFETIVIDNGSRDGSLEVRNRINANILKNRGYPKYRRPDMTQDEITEIRSHYTSSNKVLMLEHGVDFASDAVPGDPFHGP